jgi:hypothetical protein
MFTKLEKEQKREHVNDGHHSGGSSQTKSYSDARHAIASHETHDQDNQHLIDKEPSNWEQEHGGRVRTVHAASSQRFEKNI